jgi:hypothetical protein
MGARRSEEGGSESESAALIVADVAASVAKKNARHECRAFRLASEGRAQRAWITAGGCSGTGSL